MEVLAVVVELVGAAVDGVLVVAVVEDGGVGPVGFFDAPVFVGVAEAVGQPYGFVWWLDRVEADGKFGVGG